MEITLRGKQVEAYEQLIEFIESESRTGNFFTLSGKSGTGKSTVLAKVVEHFPGRIFTIAAISHKAKEELHSKIKSDNVEPTTVASLLGMRMNLETGEFLIDNFVDEVPIDGIDILIVDECSMISKEIVDMIMFRKPTYATVIFAGDEGQIRPIRKTSVLNDLSPTFETRFLFRLIERIRQGEGNPILEDSDYWWDQTKSMRPVYSNLQKQNKVNEIGGIYYTGKFDKVIKYFSHEFLKARDERDPYRIKVVTYTNRARTIINGMIRDILFPNNSHEQFLQDELLMMMDAYKAPFDGKGEFGVQEPFTNVMNSMEFSVLSIKDATVTIEELTYHYYIMKGMYTTLDGKKQCIIPVLKKEEQHRWDKFVSESFVYAKTLKGEQKNYALQTAWYYARLFAKVDYGYCISAHRSQGSTYNMTIVNLTDMLTAPINHQEIASLIYTGMTRSRHTTIMVQRTFSYTLPEEKEDEIHI